MYSYVRNCSTNTNNLLAVWICASPKNSVNKTKNNPFHKSSKVLDETAVSRPGVLTLIERKSYFVTDEVHEIDLLRWGVRGLLTEVKRTTRDHCTSQFQFSLFVFSFSLHAIDLKCLRSWSTYWTPLVQTHSFNASKLLPKKKNPKKHKMGSTDSQSLKQILNVLDFTREIRCH